MSELTEEEYESTLSPHMVNVTDSANEIVDLWGYADPVIEELYHNCSAWDWRVDHIYETKDGEYQHIGIPVPLDDTYMSVIIDKKEVKIVGHYILDLKARYPDFESNES